MFERFCYFADALVNAVNVNRLRDQANHDGLTQLLNKSYFMHKVADVLLATGEQVSIALLCMSLASKDCAARSFTGGQARIRTDTSHTKARIQGIDVDAVRGALKESQVAVVAGFQGVDEGVPQG